MGTTTLDTSSFSPSPRSKGDAGLPQEGTADGTTRGEEGRRPCWGTDNGRDVVLSSQLQGRTGMRRALTAMGVLGLLAFMTPRQAEACSLCKYAGSICTADNCESVFTCQDVSFGRNSYADCWTDSGGCHLGSEFCRWASSIAPGGKTPADKAPICKEFVLFSHEKAS